MGGEMTQTLYAHMNKIKIKKNKCCPVINYIEITWVLLLKIVEFGLEAWIK
jgi:hypothetical protein